MFEEVFKILRTGKSLELIMASYQLLDELDKVPKHTSLLQFIGYAQSSNKFFFVDFFFLFFWSLFLVYIYQMNKSHFRILMLHLNSLWLMRYWFSFLIFLIYLVIGITIKYIVVANAFL